MKIIRITAAMLIVVATQTHAQDWLTRIGGSVGQRWKPVDEQAAAEIHSVENPTPLALTLEQFKAGCLDYALSTYSHNTQGIQPKYYYAPIPQGWERRSAHVPGHRRYKISQTIEPGFYLAWADSHHFAVRLLIPGLAADTPMSHILFPTGETYSFRTVLGAPKTVDVYQPVPDLTAEDVIQAFERGASFLVPRETPTTVSCLQCDGVGFIDVPTGTGRVTRKSICPRCKGARSFNTAPRILYRVSLAH